MLKVEWNKAHTWKILKRYDNSGKVTGLKYKGVWYYPYLYLSGRQSENGSYYIARDCCCNCALVNACKVFNPIHHACEEADMLEISWI